MSIFPTFLTSPSPELWEDAVLRCIDEEEFLASPEKMYMLSLRTRRRLPDRLHEAMVMWSFDPAHADHVRMYLNWIEHCDEMRASRERFERIQRNHDRMLFCMMILSGFALVSLLVFEFFK